ncbi:MAG: hypothetical protein JXA30_01555 [Deltaproteobacteria bacterium]|nr:hypothetical protein [Deltaproteobacteria bacterium]
MTSILVAGAGSRNEVDLEQGERGAVDGEWLDPDLNVVTVSRLYNAVMVNNRVAGYWTARGTNHICSGNLAFNDEDDNQQISENEMGESLSCPGVGKQ